MKHIATAALGAALVTLAPTADAQARSDWYCGATQGAHCALGNFARRYGGHVHSWHFSQAAAIIAERPARVVLGGHSMGCVTAMDDAWKLHSAGIIVDVFFCFDGADKFASVAAPPPNIRRLYSWYQPAGLGGATFCYGKTTGNVCREQRGAMTIYEEKRPNDGHVAIGGHTAEINRQVAAAMAGYSVVQKAPAPRATPRATFAPSIDRFATDITP